MACVWSTFIYIWKSQIIRWYEYCAMWMDEPIANLKSIGDIMTYKKKLPPILALKKPSHYNYCEKHWEYDGLQKKKKKYHWFWLWIIEILQLVSEHLVWILNIDNNIVVVIYFRMVRTRKGTWTEPPSIERRSRGWNA
jgi:hypothetical protein